MDLSIIIINWNSAEFLKKCLQSIYSNTSPLDFEVIVVDNASYDGCSALLEKEFSKVKLVQSTENIGFARANNLGFKYSSGRNLLFLNTDTEIIGSAINTMFSYLESIPDAGAAGCKLLNSDLSIQTSCIQPFPTILNQVLDARFLKLRFPKLKLWGIKPLFFSNGKPVGVDVISGACLMVKRTVFDKIGMFNTDYFMYSEDVDLCYKIKQIRYKPYYISKAEVIHHGAGSSSKKRHSQFSTILMKESKLIFFKKTRGKIYAYIYRSITSIASSYRLAARYISDCIRWPSGVGDFMAAFK